MRKFIDVVLRKLIPNRLRDEIGAGAVYDYAGFLTTRRGAIIFGAAHNCAPAVDSIKQWAVRRGVDLDAADVQGWRK